MKAIGFAAIIVVMGVFLPKVLDALESFLLAFFEVAVKFLRGLPIPY